MPFLINVDAYLQGPFFDGFFCGVFFEMVLIAASHLILNYRDEQPPEN